MTDHALPDELRRRCSRRTFLRDAVAAAGAAAVLTACTPPRAAPPPPGQAPAQALTPATAAASPPPAPAQAATVSPAGSPSASPPPSPVLQAAPSIPGVPTPVPPGASAASTPKRGGTLVVARSVDATDLDPQLAPGLARQRVTMLTYNNLVRLAGDVSIQPDLAEAWKVSSDGKRIDFTLRRGVSWHPPVGRELTADDVQYSYERLLRDSPGRADFAEIDGVEVLDRYSVRFHLTAPNAGLLASMADSRWGAIVNRETVEKHGSLRATALGTGPFILESWTPGQEMRLRRNPAYFEKGKPYLESLVLRIIPSEAEIVAALRAGTVHHATLEENRNAELLSDQPGLQIHRSSRLGYDFLAFNQAIAPFNKPEVIQAFNYAIDREECIKSGAGGYAVLTAPCTPPMKQWLLPEEQWRPFYRLDLNRARELLARAGYPNGFQATALRIREADADPPAYARMQATAEVVQANLKRIGVDLRLENIPFERWLPRWQQKQFEATMSSSLGFADPDTAFYRAFHSGPQNWNNTADPELDRLLDEGRAVFEVEKRKLVYDRVQLRLLERPAHLFLYAPDLIDVTQKRVHGFSQHPTTTLWSYQHVWLDD